MTSVKGDASKILKNFKCTNENYMICKDVLFNQYNKSGVVRESLLSAINKFKFAKIGDDYTGFVSSMINLKVYLSELKQHHSIDILTDEPAGSNSGSHLVRNVVHDNLPGYILDRYQTLSCKEYPSLDEFFNLAQTVADRLNLVNKNRTKDSNDANRNSSQKSSQNTDISTSNPTSTIPAAVTHISSGK